MSVMTTPGPRELPPEIEQVLPECVTRYMAGESIQTIAADMKRSRRTIYNWLLSGLGEEKYREVVTECLVARVADADEDLDDASLSKDPVRVSAAREVCRFARMDLERRRPALYGAKQESGGGGPTIIFQIAELRHPVISRVNMTQAQIGPIPDLPDGTCNGSFSVEPQ